MMRDGMIMDGAMMWGMRLRGLFVVMQLALGIAALAKYLFRGGR